MSLTASLTDFNTLSPNSFCSPDKGIISPILILSIACTLKLKIIENKVCIKLY